MAASAKAAHATTAVVESSPVPAGPSLDAVPRAPEPPSPRMVDAWRAAEAAVSGTPPQAPAEMTPSGAMVWVFNEVNRWMTARDSAVRHAALALERVSARGDREAQAAGLAIAVLHEQYAAEIRELRPPNDFPEENLHNFFGPLRSETRRHLETALATYESCAAQQGGGEALTARYIAFCTTRRDAAASALRDLEEETRRATAGPAPARVVRPGPVALPPGTPIQGGTIESVGRRPTPAKSRSQSPRR